jgi:hypothetical protein
LVHDVIKIYCGYVIHENMEIFMENVDVNIDVDVFGNQCNTITICIYKKVWSFYNIDLEN